MAAVPEELLEVLPVLLWTEEEVLLWEDPLPTWELRELEEAEDEELLDTLAVLLCEDPEELLTLEEDELLEAEAELMELEEEDELRAEELFEVLLELPEELLA